MVIRMCRCDHPDTLHVVDPDDDSKMTPKGQGMCYDSKCDCATFQERVQLVQLVSHRDHHDDIALLVALDTLGRAWWWNDGEDEWQRWGETFLFPGGKS